MELEDSTLPINSAVAEELLATPTETFNAVSPPPSTHPPKPAAKELLTLEVLAVHVVEPELTTTLIPFAAVEPCWPTPTETFNAADPDLSTQKPKPAAL